MHLERFVQDLRHTEFQLCLPQFCAIMTHSFAFTKQTRADPSKTSYHNTGRSVTFLALSAMQPALFSFQLDYIARQTFCKADQVRLQVSDSL